MEASAAGRGATHAGHHWGVAGATLVCLMGCGWYESQDDPMGSSPPQEESPSSGGAGGEANESGGGAGGEANESGGGPTMTTTHHGIRDFDVPLAEGTFWDYRWTHTTSSFGSGAGSSANPRAYRVWLGAETEIEGLPAFPVHFGGTGERPRWNYLAFDDGVLYGSVDGRALEPILDASAGVWLGGGFFVELPDVVFAVRETSFRNSLVSGTGVVVERSASEDDTVCVDGLCVNGSAPETNLTQREFYQSGIGPVGYEYRFSFRDSSSQSTTEEAVGLVATSLRGEDGLFDTEVEPNDAPRSAQATVALSQGRGVLGDVGSGDESFIVTQTYYSSGGIEIGTSTDTLQDCYSFRAPSSNDLAFRLEWDEESCARCEAAIVVFDASGEALASSALYRTDSQTGWDVLNVFSFRLTSETNQYYLCVGINSVARLSYTLQWE